MNYIKRKEFLKKCAETFGCCGVTITAIVGIADQCSTAEAVKVVRCKDCRYCEEAHYEEEGEVPYIKLKCKWSNYSHQPNDYCSYGERRTENEG